MTSFSVGECDTPYGRMKLEIRGVNHRFLSLAFKIPPGLIFTEERIRKELDRFVKRGRIELALFFDSSIEQPSQLSVIPNRVHSVVEQLRQLADELSIEGTVSISDILHFPQIFELVPVQMDPERLWESIEPMVHHSMEQFYLSKLREGEAITTAITSSLTLLQSYTKTLLQVNKDIFPHYREKFLEIARRVTDGINLDETKLEHEVAWIAQKADITEENNRIAAHLVSFESLMTVNEPIGKKLDFILQELLREITTIGSKILGMTGIQTVIDFKSELEKIREQIQNIE